MPATQEQMEVLRGLLLEASTSLFAEQGLTLEEDARDPGDLGPAWAEHAVAISDFEGAQIRGRLALLVPYSFLDLFHPLRGSRPLTERDKRDWLCELVNQLLGLLKAGLAARQVQFEQGLPNSLVGQFLSRIFSSGGGVLRVVLQEPRARVLVLLRASIAGDADLTVEPTPVWQQGCVVWPG